MKRPMILAAALLLLPLMAAGQVVEYYHLDALGSVRVVTNQAGAVVERHDYLPFGEEWNPPPSTHPRKFTGKERDSETGLDYFGARYYGSKIGRFTTVDPVYTWRENLFDPQRWNRYAYARNNPLRYVDPDGRYEKDVHRDLTEALALAVGIPKPIAARIAAADQGVDENPATSPILGGLFNAKVQRDFHFASAGRLAELWRAFERSGSPEDLGIFFHAFQDSFSHAGYFAGLGHILYAGADKTYKNAERADAMAEATYNLLLRARSRVSGEAYEEVPWTVIVSRVRDFNRARSPQEKDRALQHIRSFADENVRR